MNSPGISTDQRIIKGSIAVLLFSIIIGSVFYKQGSETITDCAFKHITGLSCPGCGLTRSFHAATLFHFREAFGYHLLGPLFILGFLLLAIKYSYEAMMAHNVIFKIQPKTWRIGLYIIAAIWLLFWLVRMGIEIRGH